MTVLGGVLAVRVLRALPSPTAPHVCRFGTVTVTVCLCVSRIVTVVYDVALSAVCDCPASSWFALSKLL
jgi:ABC-type enterochelin transport system permease subunit